jgi:hypothetical protein
VFEMAFEVVAARADASSGTSFPGRASFNRMIPTGRRTGDRSHSTTTRQYRGPRSSSSTATAAAYASWAVVSIHAGRPTGEPPVHATRRQHAVPAPRDGEHAKSLRVRPRQSVQGQLGWSADGREIAYSARNSIHILDLSTGKDRQVSLPRGICTGNSWCVDLDWRRG